MGNENGDYRKEKSLRWYRVKGKINARRINLRDRNSVGEVDSVVLRQLEILDRREKKIADSFYQNNKGLIHSFVKSFIRRRSMVSREELYSEANLAFAKAMGAWDPKKGEFSTLFHKCFENEFRNNAGRENRRSERESQLSDNAPVPIVGVSYNPRFDFKEFGSRDRPEYLVNLADLVESSLGILDGTKSEVLRRRYFSGNGRVTYSEIGEELGLCKERIRQLINEGIESIRKDWLNKGYSENWPGFDFERSLRKFV